MAQEASMSATIATAQWNVVADAVSVFKPRIALAIMLSALGGIAVTPGPLPSLGAIAVLAMAVFLAAGSAGAFNMWVESDLDRAMTRTAGRPFAAGRFTAGPAWLASILVLLAAAVAAAWLATNAWAAIYTFLGAFTYGIVYTVWLKRRTWANIVIGGLAGSFAVLAGAAAVNPGLGPEAVILTIVLFLWTPPHFWSLAMAARDDYARSNVPMLPVVAGNAVCAKVILAHTLALVAARPHPRVVGHGADLSRRWPIGGALFTWTSLELWCAVLTAPMRSATFSPRSCSCCCCSAAPSSSEPLEYGDDACASCDSHCLVLSACMPHIAHELPPQGGCSVRGRRVGSGPGGAGAVVYRIDGRRVDLADLRGQAPVGEPRLYRMRRCLPGAHREPGAGRRGGAGCARSPTALPP
jgi:heme o synthase